MDEFDEQILEGFGDTVDRIVATPSGTVPADIALITQLRQTLTMSVKEIVRESRQGFSRRARGLALGYPRSSGCCRCSWA